VPNSFLDKIIEHKKSILKQKRYYLEKVKASLAPIEYTPYHLFKRQISQPGQVNLIAEIKKASPSKGLIRQDFDVVQIARIYEQHKVAAISVLTEDKYFLGSPGYIKKLSDLVEVPLLAKDFFIDELQVYEARFVGASAILLIVAMLTNEQLKSLYELARRLDLDCLVEVHTEEELHRALEMGVEIIGINNRDLHSFRVDLKTSHKLIPQIPSDKVIVAESGIDNYEEIQKLKSLGVHAVLIGESFMKEKDIGKKIRKVMNNED